MSGFGIQFDPLLVDEPDIVSNYAECNEVVLGIRLQRFDNRSDFAVFMLKVSIADLRPLSCVSERRPSSPFWSTSKPRTIPPYAVVSTFPRPTFSGEIALPVREWATKVVRNPTAACSEKLRSEKI